MQAITNIISLELGAYGWQPADWEQQYYPDDLPTDWRVCYYSNEFRQVWLPAAEIYRMPAQLSAWQDDLDAGFRLYLEVTPERVASPEWPSLCTALSAFNCAAILAAEHHALAEQLTTPFQRVDLWHADNLLLDLVWCADPTEQQLQLARLRSEKTPTPVQLRNHFDHFRQQVNCPGLLVFLDTPFATVEKMHQMRELYGW